MGDADGLESALENALEGMQEMIEYVPPYFVAKHGLVEYIRDAQRKLGRPVWPAVVYKNGELRAVGGDTTDG